MVFSRYRVWAMLAGIWLHRMSESDSWRAIGSSGILILLLLPGFVPFIEVTVAIALTILVFAHGLTLTETIAPAFGVILVLQVARDVFSKLAGDGPGGLSTTAAPIIEPVGECRWITLGDQIFVGCLATSDQHQQTQHTCATPHL